MSNISKALEDIKNKGAAMAVQRRAHRAKQVSKPLDKQKTAQLNGTTHNFNNPITSTRIKACILWHAKPDRVDPVTGEVLEPMEITADLATGYMETYDEGMKAELELSV